MIGTDVCEQISGWGLCCGRRMLNCDLAGELTVGLSGHLPWDAIWEVLEHGHWGERCSYC